MCASLLAILGLAGCASSTPAPLIPADLWWPVAKSPAAKKDTGKAKRAAVKRIACPPLSAADKATLTGTTARPTEWAEKGATKGDIEAHVDALELGEKAKADAASRVISEHERCRGGGGKGK